MKLYPLFSALAFILLFCGSCRLGPAYHPPDPDLPDDWKAPQEQPEKTPCVDYWWQIFKDDVLDQLEWQAIENNPNLYAALERVVEARALAGVRKADLYPQATLNPSYSDTGMLFQFFTPPGLPIPASSGAQLFRIHQFQYTLPLNMSYEIDLWGKLRGLYESAYIHAQAEEEAFKVVLLTLTTDLASSYFQLRALDAQIEFYRASLNEFKKAYDLTKSRFDKGLINYLDVTEAGVQLSNVEANLFDAMRQRSLEEDKIAVLLGLPPAQFCLEGMPLQGLPPQVPPGLPCQVLLQRPDIAEAERNMASEHALIGVAYASFLPSLELTGAVGYSSPTLKDFLTWISRYWAIGANVGQVVFDGGRNCANLAATWARFRESSAAYQQQVLVALGEVEDALNNLDMQAKQAESLSESVKWSRKAVELSTNRYKNGVANYLEVTVNQRTALDAERSLIIVRGLQYLSTIQLIKAIGGSWDSCCYGVR